jgi:predicted DNA-binding protein
MDRRQRRGNPAGSSPKRAHTSARIPRSLHAKLKVYAIEQGKSVSEIVRELLDEYERDARRRLARGQARNDHLRREPPTGGWVFVTTWHGSEEWARRIKSLVALDGTTLASVLEQRLFRKLNRFTPRVLGRNPA